MVYRSDDVRHGGTDESLAQFHRGRQTVIRGLLGTFQQSSLRDNPPSVFGETTSRIPLNQLSLRYEESFHSSIEAPSSDGMIIPV
ncbi:unnamed protein product [Protopolystoma xenopodis]|uniref:Uncharacterized protein n=1 Tax=Protopolystoma xenopodis TaxID=117903 RepID=A0A3S5AR39_9PLAT|nr:unnamed protein product [Protopolystoma xenopodis]